MSTSNPIASIALVPVSGDANAVHEKITDARNDGRTLRQLFEMVAVRTVEVVNPDWLDKPARRFTLTVPANPPTALHDPVAPAARTAATNAKADPNSKHPATLDEATAVRLAYTREVERVASFLRADLSVLVYCDKVLVPHLWRPMAVGAGADSRLLSVPDGGDGGLIGPAPYRQRQLAELKKQLEALKKGMVLVIPHLDLLAGDTGESLSAEARELTEVVFGENGSDRLLLAFADRSLVVPEVLANRFAVRFVVEGLPREVEHRDGRREPVGLALVTRDEAAPFAGYQPADLFKNVSGMNPVHLRNALKYAVREAADQPATTVQNLYDSIRAFKATTSARFEVPDVTFDHVGGYDEVKAELRRVSGLLKGEFSSKLSPKLQREMIPRGFIFYGPPGTGKTLFAKAIAHELKATIQVVSGPEITDKYVGESERKLRELFGEARRNAPAVLVFDEFDSIAGKRTGRDDGGSRAGNAVVAQILTEMDGFRPDVPMLVIGTTNRLELIDEALLRPSRFQAIKIDLPDLPARRVIAQVHAAHFLDGVTIDPVVFDLVADATSGFNGDEIRSVFRDACVGLHCEGVAATPYRFGYLVGQIKRVKQQQSLERAQARPTAGTPGAGGRVTLVQAPPTSPPPPAGGRA